MSTGGNGAAERPSLSVVIPLYNKRATVGRALDSVLAQTRGDLEILVIDDGSTDGGADLVEASYSDPRIRVVRQPNAGPGAARNAGLGLARAPYVTFLDADDAWRPELAATALSILEAKAECVAFTAAFYLQPADVDRWRALRPFGFAEGVWSLKRDTPKVGIEHCTDAFNQTTSVYRTDVVRELGGFYAADRCTYGEDIYLWIQVLLRGPVYRHIQPLADYWTADSELGISGRKGRLPVEPSLLHPEAIREVCPPQLRGQLELWFGRQAITAAFLQLDRGDPSAAPRLLSAFPGARAWGMDYWKLRARLAAPGPWRVARSLLRRR